MARSIRQTILDELTARGITRYRFARMLGVKPSLVYAWLREESRMSVQSAELMMSALELEIAPCSLKRRLI